MPGKAQRCCLENTAVTYFNSINQSLLTSSPARIKLVFRQVLGIGLVLAIDYPLCLLVAGFEGPLISALMPVPALIFFTE
jgi:hypothetical protein